MRPHNGPDQVCREYYMWPISGETNSGLLPLAMCVDNKEQQNSGLHCSMHSAKVQHPRRLLRLLPNLTFQIGDDVFQEWLPYLQVSLNMCLFELWLLGRHSKTDMALGSVKSSAMRDTRLATDACRQVARAIGTAFWGDEYNFHGLKSFRPAGSPFHNQ